MVLQKKILETLLIENGKGWSIQNIAQTGFRSRHFLKHHSGVEMFAFEEEAHWDISTILPKKREWPTVTERIGWIPKIRQKNIIEDLETTLSKTGQKTVVSWKKYLANHLLEQKAKAGHWWWNTQTNQLNHLCSKGHVQPEEIFLHNEDAKYMLAPYAAMVYLVGHKTPSLRHAVTLCIVMPETAHERLNLIESLQSNPSF